MRPSFRSLTLALLMVPAMAALAQPIPPYPITIAGNVAGCMPNTAVTVITMPGTEPAQDLVLPLGPNCSFDTVVYMTSPGGGFIFTVPCNGALITAIGQYQVNFLGSDSVMVLMTCENTTVDCLGIPGGNNLPGSPCATPAGLVGTWNTNCECVPNTNTCLACLDLGPVINPNGNPIPFAVLAANCSQGTGPFTVLMNWGDGVTNSSSDHAYTEPGMYAVCLTIADANGCSSTACDSVFVDANGGVTTTPVVYDCLQVPNGPNMPGTPCTTTTGVIGVWTSSCDCVAISYWDCLGVPAGPDVPGAPCTLTAGGVSYTGFWSDNCECLVNVPTDCLGIPNGPNLPGTPCADPATGINGIWSNTCDCVPNNSPDCEAGFWVMQAYMPDSTNTGSGIPIPFELWVWNLSSGGTGNYQFLWDFGDGTTSTDPFPTHTYGSSGPYLLCLTIWDSAGCTDTYCDSLSVDDDGILGMTGEGDVRSVLTVNVVSQLPTTVVERDPLEDAVLWPNPVEHDLFMTLNSSRSGSIQVSIVDAQGRIVRTTTWSMGTGSNRLEVPVEGLGNGMYLLRLEHAGQAKAFRFVKGN